jgi:hypothetical protein
MAEKWERVPVRDGEIASFRQPTPVREVWINGGIFRSNGDYVFLVNGDARPSWPPAVVEALLEYRRSGARV